MRKTIITLVVAVAGLVPAGVQGNGMPPAASQPAGDTATRVTQSDIQPDAPSEYTVVKGDTLWGISGRFLKDPWKWPQVWQMNQDQIKNPHLIYPGDVIRLDRSGAYPSLSLAGGTGGSAAEAAANVVRLEPRVRVEPLQSAISSIPGSVIGPFLSQPLVVEADGLDTAPAILATEESRVIIAAGDTAYADRIGSNDGINWQVYRPGTPLRDPDTGEILGYEAKYVGDARVRRFGHPTTLQITRAREEINRGDRLAPARESSYPTYVPRAPNKHIRGAIMNIDGGVSELGQYQVVAINRGARDGLEVGHVLASFHRGATVGTGGRTVDFYDTSTRWMSGLDIKRNPVVPEPPAPAAPASVDGKVVATAAPANGLLRLPDERNGLVFVFRVFDKLSYALVMRATRPIYVGDVVETP